LLPEKYSKKIYSYMSMKSDTEFCLNAVAKLKILIDLDSYEEKKYVMTALWTSMIIVYA
jgi:hypothetical protein